MSCLANTEQAKGSVRATAVSKSVASKLGVLLSRPAVDVCDTLPTPEPSCIGSDSPVKRAERRHMLCQLIAEAARYQRSFFQDAELRARLRAVRSQSAVEGGRNARSYMLLTERSAVDLLQDVRLLLHDSIQSDYTTDVAKQLHGLLLFQPQGFGSSVARWRRGPFSRNSRALR